MNTYHFITTVAGVFYLTSLLFRLLDIIEGKGR